MERPCSLAIFIIYYHFPFHFSLYHSYLSFSLTSFCVLPLKLTDKELSYHEINFKKMMNRSRDYVKYVTLYLIFNNLKNNYCALAKGK